MAINPVNVSISTNLNSTALQSSAQARVLQPLGQQVQQVLFGRPRPTVLDPANYPDLAIWLTMLNRFRRKFAALAGDRDDDYSLHLSDDATASIDEHGQIFIGAEFLRAHHGQPEVLLGALAHEIGHRPKRWREQRFQVKRDLSPAELSAICRHEEARADIFAGKAMGELGIACEPLIEFLKAVQIKPHPDYLPAEDRASLIREAHQGRAYRVSKRKSLFPALDRWVSGYLGEV